MRRFLGTLLIAMFVCFGTTAFAAEEATQPPAEAGKVTQAATCDEARSKGELKRTYQAADLKTAIEQADQTANDQVTISPDGKVSVSSECPEKATTEPGKLCFSGMLGQMMGQTCFVKDQALFGKIQAVTESPVFKAGDANGIGKELTKQLFSDPRISKGFNDGYKGIADAFTEKGGELGQIGAVMKESEAELLAALAAGDNAKVGGIVGGKILPELLKNVKDPENAANLFSQLAGEDVLPKAREFLQSSWFCEQFAAQCNAVSGVTGFTTAPADAAKPAEKISYPIQANADGTIDPVKFAERAAFKVSQSSLNGYAPPELRKLGITTGSPEEWSRLFTMLTKQESELRVAPVNPDGSLEKFASTRDSEESYGPGQFNIGEYGLKSWADVNNPDRVLDAYIKVVESGNLFRYFGSLQRPNETLQHASWFTKEIAPLMDKVIPGISAAASGDTGNTFGKILSTALGQGGSPLSGAGKLTDMFSMITGGAAGDSKSPMDFVGSFAENFKEGGLSGLLSGMTKMFSGGNGSKSGSSSGASGSASSGQSSGVTRPTGTTNTVLGGGTKTSILPPVVTTAPGTTKTNNTPIEKPIIALTYPADVVEKGKFYTVSWAALKVTSCVLLDTLPATDVAVKIGTTASYTARVPQTFSGSKLTFTLRCMPRDTRAAATDGEKVFEIKVAP